MNSESEQHHVARLLYDHPIFSTVLLLLLLLYMLARFLTPPVDAREPPVVSHQVPLIGHLIGIIVSGMRYFVVVGDKTGYPVYTLPVLNSKVYVIASPEYVTACLRETKALSFNPFIVEVFQRMAGLSNDDMAATRKDMDSKVVPNYLSDMHKVEYASLAPGPDLDKMSLAAWNEIAALLEEIPQHQTFNLFETTRSVLSVASTRATYGPGNPFDTDPKLLHDFWKFEKDLKWLLLNIFPSLTARAAYQARQRLINAFIEYYRADKHVHSSGVVQQRLRVAVQYNQPLLVTAAFEAGIVFGLLANSVPTAFWMLIHIYTDPDLLKAVRKETESLINVKTSTINLTMCSDSYLRQACPLLTSTFHEVLRHMSASLSSGRYVLADTIVSPPPSPSIPNPESFLFRAGSSVQLPASFIHYSTASNSPYIHDPTAFIPSRFADLSLPEPERNINGNFRAFGGGTTLCPGRKFAYMQIMGFVVMFVNLFELQGLAGVPAQELTKIAMAVAKPVQDVSARFSRRPGTESKKLQITIGR